MAADLIDHARTRATTVLNGFTPGQKVMTVIAAIAVVAGGVMFTDWASKPSYSPLFTNLSASDAASITSKLASDKVSYKLADSGMTIEVPVNDVYSERIKMASAGLPSSGQTGYSLLDKQGITTSEFTQQVDYQRALEGELAKTITAINGISAASVHLVIPQQDVFAQSTSQASAAVLVSMTPGQTLSPTQVQAIVHLVASSVEGLTSDNVTVTDNNGDVLAAPGTDGTQMAAGNTQQQQTQTYQTNVATSIQDMLAQVIGPNHAVVRVTADLNYDQKAQTTETYPNPKPVPLNQTTTQETYTGQGTPPAIGTLSASPTPPATTSGGTTNYSAQQNASNFAVDKVTQQVVQAPGTVNRLSVAVAVDSGAKGMDPSTIKQLVSAAAGIQPSRGDTVDVAVVPFDTTTATQAQKELKAAASAKAQSALFGEIKTAAMVLMLLLVVGAVLRSARRAPQRLPLPIGSDLTLQPPARGLGPASVAVSTGAAPAGNAPVRYEPLTRSQAELAAADMSRQINSAQPDEVAGLLRDWLSERTA
jgi:flagellar M-ring protein FliF